MIAFKMAIADIFEDFAVVSILASSYDRPAQQNALFMPCRTKLFWISFYEVI